MPRRYRHPELGHFHTLDLTKSNIGATAVPDASLTRLVQYLDKTTAPDSKKIVQILEEMLVMENIEPPVWNEKIDGPMTVMKDGRAVTNPLLRKVAPVKYQLQVELDNRQDTINRELARHRFLPFAFRLEGRRWCVVWQTQSIVRKKHKGRRGKTEIDDGAALQLILDLARAGCLNRLRRCSRCHKWLYAKFKHQNFCSTKCQQKHYARSDEWRTKRREYMREYRQRTMGR